MDQKSTFNFGGKPTLGKKKGKKKKNRKKEQVKDVSDVDARSAIGRNLEPVRADWHEPDQKLALKNVYINKDIK